jgi:hypothetical protein
MIHLDHSSAESDPPPVRITSASPSLNPQWPITSVFALIASSHTETKETHHQHRVPARPHIQLDPANPIVRRLVFAGTRMRPSDAYLRPSLLPPEGLPDFRGPCSVPACVAILRFAWFFGVCSASANACVRKGTESATRLVVRDIYHFLCHTLRGRVFCYR